MKPSAFSLLKQEWLWLILLLILALGLRLFNITATSFWIDELYSFMVANGRLAPEVLPTHIQSAAQWANQYIPWQPLHWDTLMAALKINVHMPLYYQLLNPWLRIFGASEFGLRSFSAVFSTLLLVPIYFLGKSLGGSRQVGFFALILGALVPFQIYYGQEGRMYALSLFWTAWACLAYWKMLYGERAGLWSMLYTLCAVCGLFSHYMFVFILGFHGLYLLLWLLIEKAESADRKRLFWFGLPLLALVLAAWAWFPMFQIQQSGLEEDYHFAKGMVPWHRYISLPFWQPLVMIVGSNNLARVFYFPLTVGLLAFYLGSLRRNINNRFNLRRDGFMVMWVLSPLLLQIAYDFVKHSHISVMDRYVLLISPGMLLWLGLALSRLTDWCRQPGAEHSTKQTVPHTTQNTLLFCRNLPGVLVAAMFVMAVLSVWSPSPFRDEHNKTKNIRKNMQYIADQARSGDLVLVNGPWGSNLIASYYLNQGAPHMPQLYWMGPYRQQNYALPLDSVFKPYQRVWLFRYRATNERGLRHIQHQLKRLYPHLQSGGVWTLYSSK